MQSPIIKGKSCFLKLSLAKELDPLSKIAEYWKDTPLIAFNHAVDPYNHRSWPTPWEIIYENKYDDFTKAIMIGNTLKLTNRYCNSVIQLRTYVDKLKNKLYNVVIIDETWLINYNDNGPVLIENLPESFLLENLIELESTR